ncbi:MAG: hypothetical protein IJ723_01620, partial [Ruminococcus sp.]|nr:hypothetical protein [Ruminococcus sp.]
DKAYELYEVRTSNDFQKGQQVNIQYDPKDPDIYYLFKPGDGKKFKTALMMSAFMGVIGLLLLIAGISQKPKTKTLKKNKGMTFEQWQEQQLQKEQQLQQSGIDSVDTSVSMDESAYRGTLNETNDYMDSI